jgi:transposase
MARQLVLEIGESAEYLEKSLKQAKSGSQKERLQMLWWLKTGQVTQHQQLSQRLGRSPASITRWLNQYRQGGLAGLLEVKTALGAPPKIQGEVLAKLQQRLQSPEGFSSYGAIVVWLKQEWGLEVKYDTVNRFVREKLQAKLKVPRPVSVQQPEGVVEGFKKNFRLVLMELQAIFGIPQLRYLCQDETRIGRKTEPKRVITAQGVKPKVRVAWPRDAFWLYGIVEPLGGWCFTQTYGKLNSANFQQFINEVSRQLGSSIAVMQLDGAPAHTAHALEWPDNLIPILQPAHCPEVNPIERLWQFLKSLWKGENFASLDALKQRVSQELQQLTVEQVQSLTSFDFVLDALLQAAF